MVSTGPEKPWYFNSIVTLIQCDIPDVVGISPAAVAQDLITLEHRVASEGESFLTKTLPTLGKAIDLALQGNTPLHAPSFKKRRRSSALPAFLQALTRRIFSDEGYVLENACIKSIRLLRQICFWCKKIEKGFTAESLQKAADDFIEVDRGLPTDCTNVDRRILGSAKALVDSIFRGKPRMDRFVPKHGPGNVAGGEGTVGKRSLRHSYSDLERVFRPIPFFFSLRDAAESPDRVYNRMSTEYGLSRTTFVEKDSSGPRTIGLEPAEYMWCQQAVKGFLYDHIENHRITKGQVNFTDQTINRELTSEWSRYVTLDLSKASDRNSLALVTELFSGVPWLLTMLLACRTPGTVLPDGRVLWYKKFAPMGSAVCFPIEAIVFYVLTVATLVARRVPFILATKLVYVYGDDLIVPHGFYEDIDEVFKSAGLLLSEGKCCIAGKFRESCGADRYDGVDVTPIRMKKIYPKRLRDNKTSFEPSSFIPIVEHANALMRSEYRSAARALRRAALKKFPQLRKLRLPYTSADDLPILSWLEPETTDRLRIYFEDSIPYVRGWVYESIKVRANAADEMKYLRESLCHGGAVGTLVQGAEGKGFRRLAMKYAGRLRKRKLAYWPRAGQSE